MARSDGLVVGDEFVIICDRVGCWCNGEAQRCFVIAIDRVDRTCVALVGPVESSGPTGMLEIAFDDLDRAQAIEVEA